MKHIICAIPPSIIMALRIPITIKFNQIKIITANAHFNNTFYLPIKIINGMISIKPTVPVIM